MASNAILKWGRHFTIMLSLVVLPMSAWANCESLEMENFLETSDGQCINLDHMVSGDEEKQSESANQGLPQLRLGGSLAGFDALEVTETDVAYGDGHGLWAINIGLQNMGADPVDIAIIRYQILDGDEMVYTGAVAPEDGQIAPGMATNFGEVVAGRHEVLPTAIESLTLEVIEIL